MEESASNAQRRARERSTQLMRKRRDAARANGGFPPKHCDRCNSITSRMLDGTCYGCRTRNRLMARRRQKEEATRAAAATAPIPDPVTDSAERKAIQELHDFIAQVRRSREFASA